MAHKNSKPRQSNQLRIIGGDWRGRKLVFPDAEGLRPTGDRVRETLFNWLQSRVVGARCLDAFAGSGALGLEALSRGAKSAVFCEANKLVARNLQENAALLGAKNAEIYPGDVMSYLASAHEPFDLVFLDPPFHHDWLNRVLPLIDTRLAENADIYLESESGFDQLHIPAGWSLKREKHTGNVTYGLFRTGS